MNRIKVAVGVDIGGTNTVCGFILESGNCLAEFGFKTESKISPQVYFNRLFEKIGFEFEKYSNAHELIGIGIGAPNGNFYSNTIENPPNLNWGIVNVEDFFSDWFEPSVYLGITNDANATALGEMLFGAGKDLKNFTVCGVESGQQRTWSAKVSVHVSFHPHYSRL